MYERLTKHKYIGGPFHKEPLWWSIERYEHPDFAEYLDNFIPAAQKAIVRTGKCNPKDKSSCHPLLIGMEFLYKIDTFLSLETYFD